MQIKSYSSRRFIFIFLLLLITQFSISCNVALPTTGKNTKDKTTTDKTTKDKDKKDDDSSKTLGDKQLQVHMLDIGQGDSLLIITPEKKSILIDAGLVKAAPKVIGALEKNGIETIDLVVASHPHADHIGGLPKVLDAVPAKKFLDSGQEHPTATYEKLLTKVKEKIGKLTVARAGQKFELDSGIKIEVLGPSEPLLEKVSGSVENANSVILMLSYGEFRMLFTGDSEDETEERLLEKGFNLKAQVLKVAHHGSQYASSKDFLKKVDPEVAIISCGEDNNYGHPSPPTLEKFKNDKIKVYRTDLQGEIVVLSDGKNYQIKTEHKATSDIWEGRTSSKSKKNDS
ncbi:MAG: MBL fold metallo-hydrolase [Acidobacteria bacterium]|nr:MBL fold metallo-hydrolase [Acidobacteriota bacterium]